MAVVTTALGPNSTRLDYPASESLTNLITAVENFLATHGWSLWDAEAGTNARAYRALNKDGLSYKYVVLDWNTAGYLLLKVYESWNADSHAGTNLCYLSDNSAYAQRISPASGGSLCIFAQASYLIIQSNNSGTIGSSTGNAWSGCIEVSRDNPNDTPEAGYLPYIWANGWRMMSKGDYVISFPRLKNEYVGGNASRYNFVSTEMGFGGYSYSPYWGNWRYVYLYSLYYWVPTGTNAFSGLGWAWTIRVGTLLNPFPDKRGRLLGIILITRNQGVAAPGVDSVDIKVNADGFVDPGGEAAGYWVISESGAGGRWAIPK